MPLKGYTIRLQEKQIKELEKMAEKERRKVGELIRLIIDDYLANHKAPDSNDTES